MCIRDSLRDSCFWWLRGGPRSSLREMEERAQSKATLDLVMRVWGGSIDQIKGD